MFAPTTKILTRLMKHSFYTDDGKFLRTDEKEDPEARVRAEGRDLAFQGLLSFNAVLARTDGADSGPVAGIGVFFFRFREIFSGRPGRYNLTRCFRYTSMTAGPAGLFS